MLGNYTYLKQSASDTLSKHDDKTNYRLVNEAMRITNFDSSLVKTIWSIVASVIHLGNISFESVDDEKDQNNNSKTGNSERAHAKVAQESMEQIKIISKLLDIGEDELVKALTSRLIASGSKELMTTFHSVKEASYARDALAKVISSI